jgi:hypothetical protein
MITTALLRAIGHWACAVEYVKKHALAAMFMQSALAEMSEADDR